MFEISVDSKVASTICLPCTVLAKPYPCVQVAFAAIDCTKYSTVCSEHEVQGYPTFKYFNYGKNAQAYTGGREVTIFCTFLVQSCTFRKNCSEVDF